MAKEDYKFNSHFDYEEGEHSFEHQKDKRSMTVPDLSYDIEDLINNFTKMPNIQKFGSFDPDPDFNNPIKFGYDLTDITEAQIEVAEINQKIEAAKASQTTTPSME